MIKATAYKYDPSKDDTDTIDMKPFQSSLSVNTLVVTAKAVMIKADTLSSPSNEKNDGKKNSEGKAEKVTKAPSWFKQLSAKLTGKSFSKEEQILIQKEEEGRKARRRKAWENRTKKWRSSLLKGVKSIMFDNPIANFIKKHWLKILLGTAILFSSPEDRKKMLKAIGKFLIWFKDNGIGIIKETGRILWKFMKWLGGVVEWFVGDKKGSSEDIKKQEEKISKMKKDGADPKLIAREEKHLRDLNTRTNGILDSIYKQIVLTVAGIAGLIFFFTGPWGLFATISGIAGAGKWLWKKTVTDSKANAKWRRDARMEWKARRQLSENQLKQSKLRSDELMKQNKLQTKNVRTTTPTTNTPTTKPTTKPTIKPTKFKVNPKNFFKIGGGLLSRWAAPVLTAITVGDTLMDTSKAQKQYDDGEITDKERSNKSFGAITEGGSVLAMAAAGAALGSAVPILGTAVGGIVGTAVGGITSIFTSDWFNELGGNFSDSLHEAGWIGETKDEHLANLAENKYGAVDIGMGDASIENIHKLKDLETDMLKALLKEETWSKEDENTIQGIIDSRATQIKEEKQYQNGLLTKHDPTSIANTPFAKLEELFHINSIVPSGIVVPSNGVGADMGRGGILDDMPKWNGVTIDDNGNHIKTGNKKSSSLGKLGVKTKNDVETGVGGIVGSDSAPVVKVMKTNKPEDMNSHEGVEGTWSQVDDDWVFYSKNATEKESSLGKLGIKTKNDVIAGKERAEKFIRKKYDDIVAAETRELEQNHFDKMSKEDQTKLIEFGKTRGVNEATVKGGYFDTSKTNELGMNRWHNANDRARLKTGMRFKERKNYLKEHGKEAPVAIDPLTGKPFKDLQDLTYYDMASRGAIHDPRIPVTRKIFDPLFNKTKDGEKKSTSKWLPFGHNESEFKKQTSLGDRFKQLGNWLWDDDKKDAGPVTGNTLGKTKATTTAEPIVKEKKSGGFFRSIISKKGTTPMGSTKSVIETTRIGTLNRPQRKKMAEKWVEKWRKRNGGGYLLNLKLKTSSYGNEVWNALSKKEQKRFKIYEPRDAAGKSEGKLVTGNTLKSNLGTAPIVTPTTKKRKITRENATPEEREMLNQKSVNSSLRVMRKGPRGRKSTYKRKMEIALNPKEETAKPLWDAMKPEEQEKFEHLNPYKTETYGAGLKEMMNEPVPMSDPNKRTETINQIHKQNAQLKSEGSKPAVVDAATNVVNNYYGGSGKSPAVIIKPEVKPTTWLEDF